MTFAEAVKTLIFEKPDGKIIQVDNDGNECMFGYFYIKPMSVHISTDQYMNLIPALFMHSYIKDHDKDPVVPYSMYKDLLKQTNNGKYPNNFIIVDDVYKHRGLPDELDISSPHADNRDGLLSFTKDDIKNGDHVFVLDFVDKEKHIVRHEIIFTVIDETKLGTMDAFAEYQY